MIFFSMALERAAQNWIVSLDLYRSYRDINGTGVNGPQSIPEAFDSLKLTPAFFFIAANMQVIINLLAFIALSVYTKVNLLTFK